MARSNAPAHVFRTTRWTMVLTAADLNGPEAEEALAQLCQEYYQPLYFFIRRNGRSPEETQDLLQAFFEQLLSKNFLGVADRDRGRFRTFLLTALRRFLGNEAKAQRRQKRGGEYAFVPLVTQSAEECYGHEPADQHTPESIFEKQWALAILQKAMEALRKEYTQAGKKTLFETVFPFLTEPSEAPPQAEVALKLRITEAALRVAIHRMRRHYGDLIRKEIADTLMDRSEVEEEVRHLRQVLGG